MKRETGVIAVFLLLVSTLSIRSEIAVDNSRIEFIEDSLYQELVTTQGDSTYFAKVVGLELLFMDSPRLLHYAELKEKEARKQDRMQYVCESYSDRAIYYANNNNLDSFYYWKGQMDPLALKEKEFNYYFFLCNLEVSLLIEQSKIETAIQTAKSMYDTAKQYNSIEGLVASNMSMGNAFLSAKRYVEALEAYEKALSLIPTNVDNWNSWKIEILNKLVQCCDPSGEYLKGLEYAERQQEMMDKVHQSKVKGDTKKPFLFDQWINIQLYKVHFYIKLHKPSEALHRLNDIKQYYPGLSENNRMKYHNALADYYEATGDYTRALSEFNIAYSYFMENNAAMKPSLIQHKANLLGYTGAPQEALKLYKDLVVLKDSINDAWLSSQLNELRAIYETDHLKLENSELELKSKHDQLRMAFFLCALSVLALAFISFLYVRLSRVKKDLEHSKSQLMKERDKLVESKEHLRIAKEKAEEARDLAQKAEHKESFFANMSHEIRTPLNAIVGFSNLLVSDEEITAEEQELFISTINQNCDQLLKLVNDVLDLSRMESDKMQFTIDNFNLSDITAEIYSTHKMMIPQGLEFLKEVPEQPLIVHVDKTRLKQVLSNFINNAVKFTSEGYIKMGYRLDKKEKMIILFVEDTGRGIPEEHQKKIFERFYKQNDEDKGTGLGLSICSVIAEKLGGRLNLVSEVGKGSCFSIYLPYDAKLNQIN